MVLRSSVFDLLGTLLDPGLAAKMVEVKVYHIYDKIA